MGDIPGGLSSGCAKVAQGFVLTMDDKFLFVILFGLMLPGAIRQPDAWPMFRGSSAL